MTYPAPAPGIVVRYSFLWSHEAETGAVEGRKDRPCAIVVALPKNEHGVSQVAVVPITHVAPHDPSTSIALPKAVKTALGLDAELSWVRLDELNVFSWPGHDLRLIPGTDRIDYGALPRALFEQVRLGVLALHRARRAKRVDRD